MPVVTQQIENAEAKPAWLRQPRSQPARVPFAEYVEAEQLSQIRHEFYHGIVQKLQGGSYEHSLTVTNTAVALSMALEAAGDQCRVVCSNQKVWIDPAVVVYPDVCVIAGEARIIHGEMVRNPVAIVEVLNEQTEANDRGKKFKKYRRVPGLRHYLMVSLHCPRVEQYCKRDDGFWTLVAEPEGLDAEVTLSDIGVTLPLRKIYRRVSFPEFEVEPEQKVENA